MKSLSHIDEQGAAKMVDVGHKPLVERKATAAATLFCSPETIRLLCDCALPKGDVLAVARVAGIQAAKKTPDLIPLCHSIPLESVSVDFQVEKDQIELKATAQTTAKTGVEMEALTAVTVSALTLIDMMKAVDKSLRIENVRLVSKEKTPAPSLSCAQNIL